MTLCSVGVLLCATQSSQNWIQRHAALNLIAEMSLGCSKFMKPQSGDVLQKFVLPFLGDAHHRVRWSAINAVAQMCNDYAPSFQTEQHAVIMPALIGMTKDPVVRVSSYSALAIVDFCAGLEGEEGSDAIVNNYAAATLTELLRMLQAQASIKSMEACLTAVAAIAHICKATFLQYYDHFMPLAKTLLQSATSQEARLLRGKAMECVGLMGSAVGPEKFAPDAIVALQLLVATQRA